METISIPKNTLNKVLYDVETLIEDVASLFDQDMIIKTRLKEIREKPSIGKSEKDLDEYLKKRGVKIV